MGKIQYFARTESGGTHKRSNKSASGFFPKKNAKNCTKYTKTSTRRPTHESVGAGWFSTRTWQFDQNLLKSSRQKANLQ